MLPVYVMSDMFGLYAYRQEFDRRVLLIACVSMTIGVGAGLGHGADDPGMLGDGAGGRDLGRVCAEPVAAPAGGGAAKRAEWGPGLFWCTIAGFTSFVSHTGGPPYQVCTLPLGMKKAVFAGTSTIAFAYINAIKLVPYCSLGQINLVSWRRRRC